MDAQAWVGLAVQLGQRRREIAEAWHEALSAIDVASFQTIEGQKTIAGWIDQVIDLWLADPLDRVRAQESGAALADLGLGQSQVLGQTQEILGTRLAVELPPQEARLAQQRMIPLLGELAAGFVRQTEATLNARAAEMELLRRETHHRIKNNLTVIASLLELQADRAADRLASEALWQARDRIQSVAYIHEQLAQTDRPGKVSIAAYVQDLLEHLYDAHGYSQDDVQAHVCIDDFTLGINLAAPLGLIVNELVSNAFKHAFPRQRPQGDETANEISISIHTDGAQLAVEVSDNGVGLPETLEVEKTESLGLILVKLLVRQIGGTLQIVRQERGTTFKIVAPKSRR